jgi:hypothetical protein
VLAIGSERSFAPLGLSNFSLWTHGFAWAAFLRRFAAIQIAKELLFRGLSA